MEQGANRSVVGGKAGTVKRSRRSVVIVMRTDRPVVNRSEIGCGGKQAFLTVAVDVVLAPWGQGSNTVVSNPGWTCHVDQQTLLLIEREA